MIRFFIIPQINWLKTIILLQVLSISSSVFAYDFFSDDIYYNQLSSNTVEVTYSSLDDNYRYIGHIDIPDKIVENGYTFYVISIDKNAFYGCTKLKSINIGNNIASIESYAFSGCESLSSIHIGKGVRKIGNNIFDNCCELSSIEIDRNNPIYDSRNNCNAIIETESNCLLNGCKNTIIPNSVTSIGSFAFYHCTGLYNIVIPKSVVAIMNGAFMGCTGLTNVQIPSGVVSIEDNAFRECTSLPSVSIPEGVEKLGTSVFKGCVSLSSISFPKSLVTIGEAAFSDCTGLETVALPNSVTSIGASVFSGCSNLSAVVLPNNISKLSDNLFSNCTSLSTILIPNSVNTIGNSAFSNCSTLSSIVLPKKVSSIGSSAFYQCENLLKVYSFNLTPPDIQYDSFNSVYEIAKLYVPKEAVFQYGSSLWRNFKNVETFDESFYYSDVNKDENVDISDIVAVINCIAQTNDYETADVNLDGNVDISDIVAIINFIANNNKTENHSIPTEDFGYILNEGALRQNDASITIFDSKNNVLIDRNCIYETQNGRAVGNVGVDLVKDGNNMYLIVWGSGYIAKLDKNCREICRADFSARELAGLGSPRYGVVDGDYLYVSCYGNYVAKFKKSDLSYVGKVIVGNRPEHLIIDNGYIYCTSSVDESYKADNRLAVINLAIFDKTTFFRPLSNMDHIMEVEGRIFIQGYGDAYDYPWGEVNTLTGEFTQIGNASAWAENCGMIYTVNSVTDWNDHTITNYYATYDVKHSKFLDCPFLINAPDELNSSMIYAMDFNPYNDYLYIMTTDFINNSKVYVFNDKKEYVTTFTTTGLNARKIVFF